MEDTENGNEQSQTRLQLSVRQSDVDQTQVFQIMLQESDVDQPDVFLNVSETTKQKHSAKGNISTHILVSTGPNQNNQHMWCQHGGLDFQVATVKQKDEMHKIRKIDSSDSASRFRSLGDVGVHNSNLITETLENPKNNASGVTASVSVAPPSAETRVTVCLAALTGVLRSDILLLCNQMSSHPCSKL